MERIWLKNYEPGVPAEINPDLFASLNEFFADSFSQYANLPAFTNMGKTISYAELEQQSRFFASYLQNILRIPKGERIAIMMPNLLQYPIAMIGILRAGCVVVNVNPLYTPDELEHQLKDSQATGILVLENFAHTVASVLDKTAVKHVIVTKIGDIFKPPKSCLLNFIIKYVKKMVPNWSIPNSISYKDVLAKGATVPFTKLQLSGEDIAFLQYTGGTTGKAKGAILTHRNIVANVLQDGLWISQIAVPKHEIVITALPLYHIFSLTANCLMFMKYGALNVLITNPRDTLGLIKEMKKFKFTALTGVNTLFNSMLNHPAFSTVDFSHLRISLGGGMAVQKIVAERWCKVIKNVLLEAYGLTEASPGVFINPMNLDKYNGSVGLPLSSTEISVRDDKELEVAIGEIGELWVRGPQVMRGYWQNEKETKNVLTPEGWLKTGDVVKVDSKGFVYVVDRKKDIIIVSGFKVYPNEIEDVISSMPKVLEVAVLGAIDSNNDELVKAFIVKKDLDLTEKEIIDYCHEHLTPYKVPKIIEFKTSLPKSNVGKVLRRSLR